jgi:hypothetical protein
MSRYNRGFTKKNPLIPVIEPRLGMVYHIAWAWSRGIVGVVIKIDPENKTVILRTFLDGKFESAKKI